MTTIQSMTNPMLQYPVLTRGAGKMLVGKITKTKGEFDKPDTEGIA